MATDNYMHQIVEAYREMAERANYHPMAPGDGMGHVYASQINVPEQALEYAKEWSKAEHAGKFGIGGPRFESRKAFIFALEACRAMGGGNKRAGTQAARYGERRGEGRHAAAQGGRPLTQHEERYNLSQCYRTS
jgi:hypothetical protein